MDKSETILNDLKQAMLDKKPQEVSVLRMLVAGLKNKRIEIGKKLSDGDVLKLLKKEAKKRQESIELYRKAQREDLVLKEEEELKIIGGYLPEEMSREEIVKVVEKLKENGKLEGDFGMAMKLVMGEVGGKASGKLVAEVVKEVL